MSYNPTWQNPYMQPAMQQYQPQVAYQQPTNGIIKVNGRDSAMQYQLPPNSTSPALFDNGGRTFYIVSTDGTGGPIAVALAIDGEPLQSSRAIITPAAADEYGNVTSTAIVTVPKGCCYTVAVENVAAGVDTAVDPQAINVADGNLTVARIA